MWRRLAVASAVLLVMFVATSCGRPAAVSETSPAQPSESLPLPEAYGVFLFSGGQYQELLGRIFPAPPVVEAKLPSRLIVYPGPGMRTSERRLSDFTGQQRPFKPRVDVRHFYRPLGGGMYEIIPADGFQPNRLYGLGIAVSGDTMWWYFTFTE